MSSEDASALDEAEVHDLLELHSAIHNVRTSGLMMSAFSGGVIIGEVFLQDLPRAPVLFAAVATSLVGILVAFALPRLLMGRVIRA